MNVLFLHQNFPAQFIHLAQALRRIGRTEVMAITDMANTAPDLIPTTRYVFPRERDATPHRLAATFASRVIRGEAAGAAMLSLRERGFEPDLVIGHLGWGETLFVRDVWSRTKLVVHAEYYYGGEGGDVGFDPEFEGDADPRRTFSVRTKNAPILMAVADADFGVAPTEWQGSRFPDFLKRKIAILHEGIDTDRAAPRQNARFRHAKSGLDLSRNHEVITFVNRNLEPYRGYHTFMRALPGILAARPNARAVIVGGDEVSYGPPPPGKVSWKETFLAEVRDQLPMDRLHFVGKVPYLDLLSLLQISSAHVYLTYPFVLSWSMLEAMSVGALVIGSRTAPVEEVIEHGRNGLLVDFFDHRQLAATVIEALAAPARLAGLRIAARETIVTRYDLKRICLPKWMSFLNGVTGGALSEATSQAQGSRVRGLESRQGRT